ncbi:MAG: hypothetical protein BSOLF_0846 [Candidatus Carbobacillus altaicus]|uniref:Uncharacterized protein n=1 Tax=Candidatus Carbonibacillus altaicus TaxID=2163959 RepID=A0A2R6XX86_9BACL|nr:MAG: hypothetical protein BSOLF_0846 [Candidatus Carbobacillus altaicus]
MCSAQFTCLFFLILLVFRRSMFFLTKSIIIRIIICDIYHII